jgi:hypothetical protein
MTYCYVMPVILIACTRRVLISTESSSELCTGATAHTHEDKDTTIEVADAVVQSRREQSPVCILITVSHGLQVWKCGETAKRAAHMLTSYSSVLFEENTCISVRI